MTDQGERIDGWAGDAADRVDGDEREELAETRTKMAEDRTVLANERTFASWTRTGLASAGIGLGFHALFTSMEPWWLPRAIATGFFLVGIVVTLSAEQRACAVHRRLHAHRIKPLGIARLRAVSWLISIAIGVLIVALWLLPLDG